MTTDRAHWWTQAAKMLSRTGLLWLALTAVALGSLVSSGAGLAPSARLIAASNVGSTSKLKANGPASPTAVPGELSPAVSHRAQGPDAAARRTLAGGTPVGLLATCRHYPFRAHGSCRARTSSRRTGPQAEPVCREGASRHRLALRLSADSHFLCAARPRAGWTTRSACAMRPTNGQNQCALAPRFSLSTRS